MNIATMRILFLITALCLAIACSENSEQTSSTSDNLETRANELAQKFIIADGHIDLPYRLHEYMEDISVRTSGGDFDYARAKEGGMNAPFMSIYIPPKYQAGGAKDFADETIDMVYGFQEKWTDKFAVAKSVADVRQHFAEGLISLPMGMENGAPVEGDLANLQYFFDRGIRYITLTHSKNNHICDSSYDEERKWNGLSPFGREVVSEMNRLGIMIDVSHITDSTFYQVMELSRSPALATHSSCRTFTPDWERNMSDDMIKLLAEKGGVICINFGSSFLRTEYQGLWEIAQKEMEAYLTANNIEEGTKAAADYYQEYRRTHRRGTLADVMAHIEHVIKIAGIDHVGLGSDFDGVLALPEGISDVSMVPHIIQELLSSGYSEADIEKIVGGNILRVWEDNERIAREWQGI